MTDTNTHTNAQSKRLNKLARIQVNKHIQKQHWWEFQLV